MRGLRPVLAALLVLATGADAFAQDGWITGRYRRWQPELSGQATVTGDSFPGTEIDFIDTIGMDDKTNTNELQLTLQIPFLGRMTFGRWSTKYDGSETITQDINFGDLQFTAGMTVDSEFEYTSTTILWNFGLGTPKMMGTGVSAGVSLGVDLVEARIAASSGGMADEAKAKGPVPVFGAYTRGQIAAFLFLEVEVHGLIIPGVVGGGLDGQLWQGSVSVDARFQKFFVGIGWKLFQFNVSDDSGTGAAEVEVDIKMEGLFFEIGMSL